MVSVASLREVWPVASVALVAYLALSRCRDKSNYAEHRIMPTAALDCLWDKGFSCAGSA
jgi:hypothetical protein